MVCSSAVHLWDSPSIAGYHIFAAASAHDPFRFTICGVLLDEVVIIQADRAGQPESPGALLFRVQPIVVKAAGGQTDTVTAELVHSPDGQWKLRRLWS